MSTREQTIHRLTTHQDRLTRCPYPLRSAKVRKATVGRDARPGEDQDALGWSQEPDEPLARAGVAVHGAGVSRLPQMILPRILTLAQCVPRRSFTEPLGPQRTLFPPSPATPDTKTPIWAHFELCGTLNGIQSLRNSTASDP